MGGKSKVNTFSLCGEGGETVYTGQEDLKFINSYITGDRREGQQKSGFPFLHSKTLLGFICFINLGLPHRLHAKDSINTAQTHSVFHSYEHSIELAKNLFGF